MKSFLKSSVAATLLFTGSAGVALAAHETHPVTGETLAHEQVLNFRIGDNPGSMDPGNVEDSLGFDVIRQMFIGLYTSAPDGTVVPDLAESTEVSDDKLTYTFTIKKGVTWSDGMPVTAHDFEYAWKRVVDPAFGSVYSSYIKSMAVANAQDVIDGKLPVDDLGVNARDDHTLEVKLDKPIPYFLKMLATATTFPVPKWTIQEHGAAWTRPENIVVSGPYILTDNSVGERIVLERNPAYHDADAPIIDTAILHIVADENQAFNRYQAGEIDTTEVPTGRFAMLKKERPAETFNLPILCSYYYAFNLRENGPEYLKDNRVRKALSYAVDRYVIAEQVMAAGQIPAYTFTPGSTADFVVPDLIDSQRSQMERVGMAKQLMEEAGFGPDNPLEVDLIYNTSEGHKKIAIAISQMWKQNLGVETNINNLEWKTMLEERNAGNFEIARHGWCADYNEASTFLGVWESTSSYNDSGYSNPEFDALMKEAQTMADPQINYTKAEAILQDDDALIPVYHYTAPRLMAETMKGYPWKNAEENWYVKSFYRVEK